MKLTITSNRNFADELGTDRERMQGQMRCPTTRVAYGNTRQVTLDEVFQVLVRL